MIRLYVDESGHSEDPNVLAVAVAGGIARLDAWESLQAAWGSVLGAFGVTGLHMREFAHSRGQFEGWAEAKRQDFLGQLVEIMDQQVSAYVGGAMSLRIYSKVRHRAPEFGDPYHGCFIQCLSQAERYVDESGLPADTKIEVVCGNHPEFAGMALQIFNLYRAGQGKASGGKRLGGIRFASPRDVLPLQVADLVAYETRQYVVGRIRRHEALRWPMQRIRAKGGDYLRLIRLRGIEDSF